MSVVERARKAQRGRQGPNCGVGIMLATVQPAYRKDVQAAMDDPSIYSTVISEILAQDGINIAYESIQRHRRGRCMCGRKVGDL
jgi:hypothetical protein